MIFREIRPDARVDEDMKTPNYVSLPLMTSAISAAISATMCVAVLRASLSASEGLYSITCFFVTSCQIGRGPVVT